MCSDENNHYFIAINTDTHKVFMPCNDSDTMIFTNKQDLLEAMEDRLDGSICDWHIFEFIGDIVKHMIYLDMSQLESK